MASYNPFNYSEWLRCETSTSGSHGTGEDVELGRRNYPDVREGTQIFGHTPNNVALAGIYEPLLNQTSSDPGVGVYGEGHNDRGIGVAGACNGESVGVYGMATGAGVGVVGRQTGGFAAEDFPPVWMVGKPAGVLGHANQGVGVFGHGGPLPLWQDPLEAPSSDTPVDPWCIGGIFSAGWRIAANVPPARKPQLVSASNRPQIQLLPSNNQTLPDVAQLGEIYFVMAKHGSEAEKATVGFLGQLWICTQILDQKPIWQPVLLGIQQPGGTEVPTYVYPP
jgi:hypothetical protein